MMLIENLESRVLMSAGGLARGFGTGGQIDTPAGQSNELIAVQGNGAFIIAGSAQNSDLTTHGFLERFHANGKVDSSFGDHGRLDLPSATISDVASLALAPGGKIVIVGADGKGNDIIEQFTSSGKADSRFGTAGIAALPAGANSPVVKVAPKGDVVVAANYALTNSSSPVGVFLRYTSKGKVDTHFGVNGNVITDAGVGYVGGDFFLYKKGQIESLFYSPASDTITNPTTGIVTNGPFTALELFDANGNLDLTFNQNQGLNIPGTNANRFVVAGYILSVGSTAAGTTSTAVYFSNGSLVPNFLKKAHPPTLAFPANAGNSTDRIVLESGNNILIVENGTTGSTPYVALGGLTSRGRINHAFGRTGVRQISPAQTVIAAAGDGSHVILLESPGVGLAQQILEYTT